MLSLSLISGLFLPRFVRDPGGALMLAGIVFYVGRRTVRDREWPRKVGISLGGIVFLLTVWLGIAQGLDFGSLTMFSLAWAGLTLGSSWILLAAFEGLNPKIIDIFKTMRNRRESATASARRKYEERLRLLESAGLDAMELAAAREQAKQQYLREIDKGLR